jgi:hypothetical protein
MDYLTELVRWIYGKSKWNLPIYIITLVISTVLIVTGSNLIIQSIGLFTGLASGYDSIMNQNSGSVSNGYVGVIKNRLYNN